MGKMKIKFQESRENEVYTDLERGPYMESKKSKVTRVMRIYGLFSELSQVEKDNFINLLQNSKHIKNYY